MPKVRPLAVVLIAAVASPSLGQPANPLSPKPANPLSPAAVNPLAPRPAAARSAVVLRPHRLTEARSGALATHTVLLPDGWRAKGGAWWPPPQYFKVLPSHDVTLDAPDGRQVRFYPDVSFVEYRPEPQVAAMMGGRMRPPEFTPDGGNVIGYLPEEAEAWRRKVAERFVPLNFPNATNVQVGPVEEMPEETRQLREQIAAVHGRFPPAPGEQKAFDARALTCTTTFDEGGRRWEVAWVWGTHYLASTAQGFGTTVFWGQLGTTSAKYPAGAADREMPLMKTVVLSMRPTPEYRKMVSDILSRQLALPQPGTVVASNWLEESIKRQNARMDAIAATGKAYTAAWQSSQTSQAVSHRAFVNTTVGQEDYLNPANSPIPIQLPNNFNHAFGTASGEYVLTNDPNYDPARDPALNGKTWEPIQRVKLP